KSELEAVRAQCSDLKQSLFEDEAEKEKLRKQISQLKSEIKKKGDALTSIEKRFRDTSGRNQLSDGSDKVKGNCLGNFYNFIYEEGKGAPEQNCGAGEQSRGSKSEFYFT
ncbi:myosin-11-like, partial [Trifolium medium]|nr:myosin-11-like [Trifolium medium]